MAVTRRGFIGAVGAFAGLSLTPAWWQFKTKRTIDLTPFCHEPWDHARYALDKPFAQGGQVIATDARILVRTTLADVPELGDEARLPDVAGLTYWTSPRSEWRCWPKASYIANGGYDYACPICLGKGGFGSVRKCVECRGDGYVPILSPKEYREWGEGSYERPCKACRKTGWLSDVRCDYCKGEGETSDSLQAIGGLLIHGHYDAKLRALGDLEYSVIDFPSYKQLKDGGQILAVRGDGFDGLVMPVEPAK